MKSALATLRCLRCVDLNLRELVSKVVDPNPRLSRARMDLARRFGFAVLVPYIHVLLFFR